MAIYSLNHKSIGRSTHAAGTAGAHVGYITRASACRLVIAENMPTASVGSRGGKAREWLDEQEQGDRKNGRVIDKFMLALPLELDQAQRVEVVRAFVQELTGGKPISFLAAFHDKVETKDSGAESELPETKNAEVETTKTEPKENPHAHLVIRDRCPETGKRVIGMSDNGSTERAREVWEKVCNSALALAGSSARIDRRSFKKQGIEDRTPGCHEGPNSRQIEAKKEGASHRIARIRKAREERKAAQEAKKAHELWEQETRQSLQTKRRFELEAEAFSPDKLDKELEKLRSQTWQDLMKKEPEYPAIVKLQAKKQAQEEAWEARKAAADKRQMEALEAVSSWKKARWMRTFLHVLGLRSEELAALEEQAEAAVDHAESVAAALPKFVEEGDLQSLWDKAAMMAVSGESDGQRQAERLEAVRKIREELTPEQIEQRRIWAQEEQGRQAGLLELAIRSEQRSRVDERAGNKPVVTEQANAEQKPKSVSKPRPEPDSGPSPGF